MAQFKQDIWHLSERNLNLYAKCWRYLSWKLQSIQEDFQTCLHELAIVITGSWLCEHPIISGKMLEIKCVFSGSKGKNYAI